MLLYYSVQKFSPANGANFFAKRLHDTMAGLGTKDNELIRLVVTHSKIDMREIKSSFKQMYKKSLGQYIFVRFLFTYSKI